MRFLTSPRAWVVVVGISFAGPALGGVIGDPIQVAGPTPGLPQAPQAMWTQTPNAHDPANGADYVPNFTGVGSIDWVFQAANSGGVTEYDLVTEPFNGTGQAWTGYQMQLGFGTASSFVPVSGAALDFDLTSDMTYGYASSPPTTSTGALLSWPTVGLPKNGQCNAIFSVNVPDNTDSSIPSSSKTANGYQFTLRETALVPEPGSLTLLAAGAALLGLRRRRGPGAQRLANHV